MPVLDHALVIGAGGLGCPALLALVAAGTRRITVIDGDTVEASNLQRQVLFTPADVGVNKARAATRALALRGYNSATAIENHLAVAQVAQRLDDLQPDVVLECTDCPSLKFAVNDACVERGTPCVIGGVLGLHGQIITVYPGGPCYRCIYEAPPPAELAPDCAAAGVLGPACGHIGWSMVTRAIAPSTAAALTDYDFLSGRIRDVSPSPRPGCPACAGARTPADDAAPAAHDLVAVPHSTHC